MQSSPLLLGWSAVLLVVSLLSLASPATAFYYVLYNDSACTTQLPVANNYNSAALSYTNNTRLCLNMTGMMPGQPTAQSASYLSNPLSPYGLPSTTFWFRVYDRPGCGLGVGQIIAGAWDSGSGVAQRTCVPLITQSAGGGSYHVYGQVYFGVLPNNPNSASGGASVAGAVVTLLVAVGTMLAF